MVNIMEAMRIKARSDKGSDPTVNVGGWYQGKLTYLWIGTDERCLLTLSGQSLYRLAKAIVRNFDEDT